MGNVIPFPTRPSVEREMAARLLELVILGKRDSEEFRNLSVEICRRKSNMDAKRPLRQG